METYSTTEHNMQNTIALLSQTPATLSSLLRNLPDSLTRSNEGENTWTLFEVVGHLVYAERNAWIQRAKVVFEQGKNARFEPFDRLGYIRESEGKSMGELLDEFARLRSQNLEQLRAMNLSDRDLERQGQHPTFGLVTLSQLLATWPAHDLTHLHQISRILAYQYRDTVGPFKVFLGVMKCGGHSSSA